MQLGVTKWKCLYTRYPCDGVYLRAVFSFKLVLQIDLINKIPVTVFWRKDISCYSEKDGHL